MTSVRKSFKCLLGCASRCHSVLNNLIATTKQGWHPCVTEPNSLSSMEKNHNISCYHYTTCATQSANTAIQNVFDNQPNSWLFVSDAVAGAYGAQVNLNLDLTVRLAGEQLQKLLRNMEARKIHLDIDRLLVDYAKLQEMERRRNELQDKKEQIINEFEALKTHEKSTTTDSIMQDLNQQMKLLKANITEISKNLWKVEETVMLQALNLPNDLHDTTPVQEDNVVLKESKSEEEGIERTKSHIEIGKKYRLVKFSNVGPKAYYLRGELVHAEMSLSRALCDSVQSQGYRLMAGPEFVKTPIMEGCGRNVYDTQQVLTMQHVIKKSVEPMNHLTGVSPMTFAAFVAKVCLGDYLLPFKMFSCGRAYRNSDLPGLFGALQSTQLEVFCCTREGEVDKEFDSMYAMVWDLLAPLGFPLRACQLSSSQLRREEKRRVEIEMFSPALERFIQVAHVSDLGDFISRRLMTMHNQNHGDFRQGKMAHMVSGTVLNLTSFLAIWMEHSDSTRETFSLCSLPGLHTQR